MMARPVAMVTWCPAAATARTVSRTASESSPSWLTVVPSMSRATRCGVVIGDRRYRGE